MPIRTNRGRAAVYRRLWAWPLRSPRHLVAAALAFLVVATAIGFAVPKAAKSTSHGATPSRPGLSAPAVIGAQPGSQPGSTATLAPSSTTPVPRATTVPPSPAVPAPEALAVAEAWARAWVNHPAGMTSEQWVAQLVPLTTDEFLPQLRTVDPANIPSTAVTGKAEPISSSARAVDVMITTNGAKLMLTVIATDAGWRVSAFNRAD
jgi:hypothetical protein